MKFSKLFLVALGSISVLVSCNNDEDNSGVAGAFGNGVIILNEGNDIKSSTSFISNDLTSFTQDVYGSVNTPDNLGGYAQSMFFNGDNAYVLSGQANTITVVNRYTFELITKIDSGLIKPRYGVVVNGKAYVTNVKTYGSSSNPIGHTDDFVAVINLTTNLVEATIPLNTTANRIILENGKLYITEPYNNDKVLVINPTTNTLEAPINIGAMEVKDGYLYVLQGGYPGKLSKIKLSDKTVTTIDFPSSLNGAGNLDIYENKIYYTVETSVYAMDLTATTPSTTPIITYPSTSAYGKMYGFAVNNGHIFVADGGDFTANCNAYVYSLTGTLEKTLNVGVGPNGFYFNN